MARSWTDDDFPLPVGGLHTVDRIAAEDEFEESLREFASHPEWHLTDAEGETTAPFALAGGQ